MIKQNCLLWVFTSLATGMYALPSMGAVSPVIPANKTVIHTEVQPFDLSQVSLLDGIEKTEMKADQNYLHALDADRLLYNFRKNAGLPAPGKPLGGWEAPSCELRGHFVGHYLSACALMYRSTGDKTLEKKADYIVSELGKCQNALNEDGYLSAFPSSFFDRLEAGKPVWAPYYTIHKIMAGLVDMYQYCGNKEALQIAEKMAGYFEHRTDKLSDAQFSRMLQNEFGGMANVLYDLYEINHRPADLALAHRFDQPSFLTPLAHQQDDLTGIHANTHIPKILGAARRYELLNDPAYRTITTYFWDRIVNHRSYATGGSNEGEGWGPPDKLAHTLAPNNQETCTSYNMLKVTRDLIRWTANPKYADFYERLYFNGILPAQNPANGMMIYYMPLAAGNVKNFGDENNSFWCCYGTGVESFAKLNDSIYFHSADALYVNLYVASKVNWPEKSMTLVQNTRFPQEQGASFTFRLSHPTRLSLMLHIPEWTENARLLLNGKHLTIPAKPSSYARINREWRNGDTVRIELPMHLYTIAMPDDADVVAAMYGPITLAGIMATGVPHTPDFTTTGMLLTSKKNIASWLKPIAGKPLSFKTMGQPENIVFIPLYEVIKQPFAVYWSMVKPGGAREQQFKQDAARKKEEAARIVDQVIPGDQQSEKAHHYSGIDSGTGTFNGRTWRDGQQFQWELSLKPDTPVVLRCTYWGSDGGSRAFDILVNGKKIASQTLENNKPGEFFDVEYPIPADLIPADAKSLTIRFVAHPGNNAGGIFACALIKKQQ
jgi:DUF1680 family protein